MEVFQQSPDDINNQKSITQTKYKDDMENEYSKKKIVALLEPFLGVGRVVAKLQYL